MNRLLASHVMCLALAGLCQLAALGSAHGEPGVEPKTQDCTPSFTRLGPDAAAYGSELDYPLGTIMDRDRQSRMVATFSNFDRLLPAHSVAPPAMPSPLARNCDPQAWRYDFEDQRLSIDQYLVRNPTMGLLIARGSTILFEHCQYGRRDTDRFVSQSITPRYG